MCANRLTRAILCLALGLVPSVSLGQARAQSQESVQLNIAETRELTLQIGEQRVLSAEGVRSYSEGKRGVVEVRLTRDAKQFVLVALQPGTTTVLFLMTDGREEHIKVTVEAPIAQTEGGIVVQQAENIRLDFYFVQVDRGYMHQIGPAYPSSVTAGTFSAEFDFLSRSLNSATAVVADQALLRLDVAQTKGWAKLQRKAAVITENGQPATFSGGGEVNIPVQGGLGTGIHAIQYGSTIDVLPRYDSSTGRLELQIAADVSDLSDDRGTGVPGRVRSDLKTVVNLELGQTIVLAGLSAKSEIASQGGLPFLSQIPILGHLFGTHRSESKQVENVIFIVPSVVDMPGPEARIALDQALRVYGSYKGKLQDKAHFPAVGTP